jgi:transcriptional regulator with XRE-family HTH domain
MSLQDKLQKIASSNQSNWVEETGKQLSKAGVQNKARKIALRVLHILRDKGMTQSELAERMGVSRQHVTKIVKGQENITLETIDKLELALDTTLITITSAKEIEPESQISLSGSVLLEYNQQIAELIKHLKLWQSKKSTIQVLSPYIKKSKEHFNITKSNLRIIRQVLLTKDISVKPTDNSRVYTEFKINSENLDYSKS